MPPRMNSLAAITLGDPGFVRNAGGVRSGDMGDNLVPSGLSMTIAADSPND